MKKQSDTELEMEIYNEDHTVGNILAENIARQKGVSEAYYRVEHPLKNSIILYIRTDGSVTPLEALKKSLDSIESQMERMSETIMKGLEDYEKRG